MIDVCFWCNRAKNKQHIGEPSYINYEPCDDCKKWWSNGIVVIQVEDNPNGKMEIIENVYPTGKWVVISEEDVKKVLTDYPALDKIIESKTMYVNIDDWDKVINV